jgi:hypothetical protein
MHSYLPVHMQYMCAKMYLRIDIHLRTGPIIRQVPYSLTGAEKAAEVLSVLFKLGTHELINSLPSIFDGTLQAYPQVGK